MARKLAILAGLASLGLAGFAVALMITPGNPIQIRFNSPTVTTTSSSSPTAGAQLAWVAAAPGRVEPRTGQIRIGAAVSGRVEKVTINMNDRVVDGEVLIRLEDKEARAVVRASGTRADGSSFARDITYELVRRADGWRVAIGDG